eukprot:TRINITY_DN4816_c0_g1_i1.p1 TRINITY_DN4816_c0_g1~~TRINITY_DN4816_c0_g1_i1.p1  ORF type:complete len:336 (+),score=47.73 TRINITY_DN4816_c0_g1_i1:87-1094(+)
MDPLHEATPLDLFPDSSRDFLGSLFLNQIQQDLTPERLEQLTYVLSHSQETLKRKSALQSILNFAGTGTRLHKLLIEAGLLGGLVEVLRKALDSEALIEEFEDSELYMATQILSVIARPEVYLVELVEVNLVPVCVRLVYQLGKCQVRKELVRILLAISESVWTRRSISEAVSLLIPASDQGEDGSFNSKIERSPFDSEERHCWVEMLKNTDLSHRAYFSGKKIWYNPCNFPQLSVLEENWQIIRDESVQAIRHFLVAWPEKNICEKGWNVFPFKAFDNSLDAMCALAPKTAKILDSIPNVTTALFSTVRPRTHIKPHVDLSLSLPLLLLPLSHV